MNLVIDTSIFQNVELVRTLTPLFAETMKCYEECDFMAPCRTTCQQRFTDKILSNRDDLMSYIRVEPKEKTDAVASGSPPVTIMSLLAYYLALN